ncbi:hypothetical protein SBV1_260011 [Verrucomicrobia bacterium]|nr:hypothetical protein SBV1_260011 [Verrucomicrobiota bacterium]
MTGLRKPVGTRSGVGKITPLIHPTRPVPVIVPSRWTPGELLQDQRYRELIRKHLSRIWDRLFAQFTGLHFHIAWKTAVPKGGDAYVLPSRCSACCKVSGSPLRRQCRTCCPPHLRVTLESGRGHRFTCPLGVRNYWLPVRVRSQTLGIAYLQALEHSPLQSPKATSSAATAESHFTRRGAIVLSRLNFARAARFLHEVVQHVQTASLSDLRKADLNAAARSVVALEREQTRLHEALSRYLPSPPATARISGPQSALNPAPIRLSTPCSSASSGILRSPSRCRDWPASCG